MYSERTHRPESLITPEKETDTKHLPPADFAKIYAAKVFGDDDVGGRLLVEDLLHGLRGEEKQELEIRLANKEVPAPLEVVKLYEGKRVVVGEDYEGENPQFLLTNELNGCIATVLFSEDTESAKREVAFTHFPPFMNERNMKMIDELVTPEMKAGSKKKILVFCQEKRSERVSEFVAQIKDTFGSNAEVEIVKYKKEGKEDDGTLLVRIPKIGAGPMSIHHSAGDINI